MAPWASGLLKLVKPLLMAIGLWKVKESGRREVEQENLEKSNEALQDRVDAEQSVADRDDDELTRMLERYEPGKRDS